MKSSPALTLAALATLASPLVPTATALTPTESAQILYLKQEEKLARDVYQVLAAKWGTACFANLARSEARHMAAIDTLIQTYALQDPTPADAGKYSIPELQTLHDQLLAEGSVSLDQALAVGIAIEEADIADLKEVLAEPHDAAITRVFSNLLQGSQRHLASLENGCDGTQTCTSAGTGNGGSCQGNGNGNGNGNGKGKGKGGAGTGTCPSLGGGTACTGTGSAMGKQAGPAAGTRSGTCTQSTPVTTPAPVSKGAPTQTRTGR